jgi:hypothetical protein
VGGRAGGRGGERLHPKVSPFNNLRETEMRQSRERLKLLSLSLALSLSLSLSLSLRKSAYCRGNCSLNLVEKGERVAGDDSIFFDGGGQPVDRLEAKRSEGATVETLRGMPRFDRGLFDYSFSQLRAYSSLLNSRARRRIDSARARAETRD